MASKKRQNTLIAEPLLVVSKSGSFCTKKEMAARRTPLSCPLAPPKLRRRNALGRTLLTDFGMAKPIALDADGVTPALSALYDKNEKKSYLDQLFDFRMKIGEGCFGVVYKAVSREDGKRYAIKYLKATAGTSASKTREILNYQMIGSNEYFVKFIQAWEEQQQYYIQMECCLMSLAAFASGHHNFPEGQLWDILVDMLLALKHLHGGNFIHLDVKPENILISHRGVYKLGDFGLVVNLKELKARKKRALNLSEGDSRYLACEVLEGIYTTSCDVFSLGVTLLELATDLVLPANGISWHELRRGAFPELFFERVGADMAKIIPWMMLLDYKQRPSAPTLLKIKYIKHILQRREINPRVNYITNEIIDDDMAAMENRVHNGAALIPKVIVTTCDSADGVSDVLGSVLEDDNVAFESQPEPDNGYVSPATVSSRRQDAGTPPGSANSSPEPVTPPSRNNSAVVFRPMSREINSREERAAVSLKRKSLRGSKLKLFN